MKKVGILTYHHYYNYGTMLQALALQKSIEEMGYVSEIIDYQRDNHISFLDMVLLRLKRIPAYLAEFDKYHTLSQNKDYQTRRKQLFDSFYKLWLKVGSDRYSTIDELKSNIPSYDGYVIGSDQTWNPYVANRPEAFYLTFVKDPKKKGSYAPSLPVSDLSDEQRDYLKNHLVDFAYLSCREKTGAAELQKILNRHVECVVDPTLLIDSTEWSKYEENQYGCEDGEYILVYFLGDNKKHREIVRYIQKKTGYKVICIPMSYLEMKAGDWEKATVGPSGFLKLIHNAKLVCTDSFHGTMFSLNYEKQFFSFCKMKDAEIASNNARLYDSLSMFSLDGRIIRSISDIEVAEGIDYAVVRKIIKSERERAKAYLEDMLQNITA